MAIPKDCNMEQRKVSGHNGQICLHHAYSTHSWSFHNMMEWMASSRIHLYKISVWQNSSYSCLFVGFTQTNSSTSAQTNHILRPYLVMDILPTGQRVNMRLLNVWIEYSVSLSPWLTCHFGWRCTRVSIFPFLFRGVHLSTHQHSIQWCHFFAQRLLWGYAYGSKTLCNKFDGIGCATGLFSKPMSRVLLWLYAPKFCRPFNVFGRPLGWILIVFCSFEDVLQGFEFRVLKVLRVFRVQR